MQKVLLALMLIGSSYAWADQGIPRCWQADQPGQKIQEGIFRVFIPIANTNALAVARVLAVLGQSLTAQKGAGTSLNLDRVEIDVYGDLTHWRETAAFPTLELFKSAIVATIEPVLLVSGVSVTCAVDSPHFPVP